MKPDWVMRAVWWWNHNADRVVFCLALFAVGMIVGSMLRYAR